MEFRAYQKWIRMSAQKGRLVADAVRGMDVQEALDTLKFMPQKAALYVGKAVRSALANAREYKGDPKPDVDRLFLRVLTVDGGPKLKRMKARAYGRANRIMRPTSHVAVVLAERPADETRRGRRRAAVHRVRGPAPKGKGRGEKAPEAKAAAPAAEKKAKPRKPRLFGFGGKDKYGAKVKSEGPTPERGPVEHIKTEGRTHSEKKGK